LVDGRGAKTTGNFRSEENEFVGEESTESREGISGGRVMKHRLGRGHKIPEWWG
jgi:hypothetical protein